MKPAAIVMPIATHAISVYRRRVTSAGRSALFRNWWSRNPGKIATSDANTPQNVVTTPQIHTPAMPPGILYGRCTCGWLYRSLITVGKIRMYDSVVNVRTTPIITLNVAAALPLAIFVAAMNTIVDSTPDRKLTLTGVPSFAEKRPSTRGP